MAAAISILNGDLWECGDEVLTSGSGRFIDILNDYVVYFMYAESSDSEVFVSLASFVDGLAVLHAWMKCDEIMYIAIAFKRVSLLVKVCQGENQEFIEFLREIDKKCEILPVQIGSSKIWEMESETELDRLGSLFGISFTKSSHNYVIDQIDFYMRCFCAATRQSTFSDALKAKEPHLQQLLRTGINLDREQIDVMFITQLLITVSMGFMINSHFYGFSSDLADLEALKSKEIDFDSNKLIEIGYLGAGSSGEVLPNYSTTLHHVFAVKTGRSASISLKREYRIIRKMEHPTIVHAFGKVMHGEQLKIVTELCAYGNLARVSTLFDATQQMKICLDVIFALERIHRAGYVWRDGKSTNVVVDFYGSAKLCDFGSACRVSEARNGLALNVTPSNQTDETRKYNEFTVFTDLQMTVNFLKQMDKLRDGVLDIRYNCKEMTHNIHAMRPTTSVYLSMLLRHIATHPSYDNERGVLIDRIEILLKARSKETHDVLSDFVFDCLKANFVQEYDAKYVIEHNSEAIELLIHHVCLDPYSAKRVLALCNELDETIKPLLQKFLVHQVRYLLPSCDPHDDEFVAALAKFIRELPIDQLTPDLHTYCSLFMMRKDAPALTDADMNYGGELLLKVREEKSIEHLYLWMLLAMEIAYMKQMDEELLSFCLGLIDMLDNMIKNCREEHMWIKMHTMRELARLLIMLDNCRDYTHIYNPNFYLYKVLHMLEYWMYTNDRDREETFTHIATFRAMLHAVTTTKSQIYSHEYGRYLYAVTLIMWARRLNNRLEFSDALEVVRLESFVRETVHCLKVFQAYGAGLVYIEEPDFCPACVMALDAKMLQLIDGIPDSAFFYRRFLAVGSPNPISTAFCKL